MTFAAEQTAQGPGLLVPVLHAAFYAGVLLLAGTAVTSRFALRALPRASVRVLSVAWPLAGLGATGIWEVRRRAIDAGFFEMGSTAVGRAALLRFTGLAIAYAGVVRVSARARDPALWAILAGAIAAIAGHVSASHAAAGPLPGLQLAAQTVHLAAVAVWAGGLAALLLCLREIPRNGRRAAARRFSAPAFAAFIAMGATGIVRALQETGGLHPLTGTTYGKIVILKAELLVLLAILAALNRYRNVPAAQMGGLRRAGSAEIAVAAVVLALTAMLSGTAPGREAIATSRGAPSVTTFEQGGMALTEVRYPDGSTLQASLDPGRAGHNEIHLSFFDPSGDEMAVTGLTVEISHAGRLVRPALQRFTPGHYVAGARLTAGTWEVAISAEGGLNVTFAMSVA